jgi:hypothetical protein
MIMKNYTDKELADYMLEMRQKNGQTPWRYRMTSRGRWVYFFGLVGLLLAIGVFARSVAFCGFVVGMAVGIFSRDGAYVRQYRAVWPFYAKVIDWPKVERIADGQKIV